jgi:hypothetical protein
LRSCGHRFAQSRHKARPMIVPLKSKQRSRRFTKRPTPRDRVDAAADITRIKQQRVEKAGRHQQDRQRQIILREVKRLQSKFASGIGAEAGYHMPKIVGLIKM